MIRTSRQSSNDPIYRTVVRDAIRTAWHNRRFWPLAFFSAILMTGGTYDVMLRAINIMTEQTPFMSQSASIQLASAANTGSVFQNLPTFLAFTSGLQAMFVIVLILIALAVLSCVSQGGLVYAIGASHRGTTPTLRDAIRVGGGAFWPIAALNAAGLLTVWAVRFIGILPLQLALQAMTKTSWLVYLISAIVMFVLLFAVSTIQIFALNAMVLQGAPVQDAVIRGYKMFSKHWVICVETALMLGVLAVFASVVFVGVYFVVAIPLLATVLAAGLLQSTLLLYGAMGLGLALLIVSALVATAFVTQAQYASWTFIYRRLGEGGALPKLHRLARLLTGNYSVPQK